VRISISFRMIQKIGSSLSWTGVRSMDRIHWRVADLPPMQYTPPPMKDAPAAVLVTDLVCGITTSMSVSPHETARRRFLLAFPLAGYSPSSLVLHVSSCAIRIRREAKEKKCILHHYVGVCVHSTIVPTFPLIRESAIPAMQSTAKMKNATCIPERNRA
jgi:hypothetical protein